MAQGLEPSRVVRLLAHGCDHVNGQGLRLALNGHLEMLTPVKDIAQLKFKAARWGGKPCSEALHPIAKLRIEANCGAGWSLYGSVTIGL